MCGRFALATSPDAIRKHFGLERTLDLKPRYNIAPSTPILAIRQMNDHRRADPLVWGLIPHWSKERKTRYSTINARAETVGTAPSYREPFRRQRCLIPADGFYEWQPQQGKRAKQPYFIARADGALLAMAGLWDRWADREGGQVIESCTILVTWANKKLEPIHNRMPVLLDPEQFDTWLDPENQDKEALKGLLQTYPGDPLQAVPVSGRVNNPRNDDPELIASV